MVRGAPRVEDDMQRRLVREVVMVLAASMWEFTAAAQPAPPAIAQASAIAASPAVVAVPVVAPAPVVAPVPAVQAATPAPAPTPAPVVALSAPARAPQAPAAPTRPPRAAAPAVPPAADVAAPEAPRPPRQRGQPVNVRLEILATDQSGTKPPITKTMTVTVADGESARVRNSVESQPSNGPARQAYFSVDARAFVEGDRVRVDFSLDYNAFDEPAPPTGSRATANVRLSQGLVLENGKSLVISQSTDPMTDRKFTVEVKATVIK
jgi:hypothetical protein